MLVRPLEAVVARALLVAMAVTALGGCATNPATGRKQLTFFGEEAELNMGNAAATDIVSTVGIYDDEGFSAYVARVGGELAAVSERPYLPWTFEILDDPTVNAFALPGGHVYVTRGILAELGSEAELAAVLGHEIGHVCARHTLHRQSEQILATVGVGIAAVVLDPRHAEDWLDLGTVGLGLLFLEFSRQDERQADDLGLRYLLRAGYDPREMPPVFEMLERVAAAEGGRVPVWLTTHPDPGARRARIAGEVSSVQAEGAMPPAPRVARDLYLQRLPGLVYGPDPSHGARRAGEAVHPALGFRLQAPAAWRIAGSPTGLTVAAPDGAGTLAVALSSQRTPQAAEDAFFAHPDVTRATSWESESAGGRVRWTRFGRGGTAGTVAFVAQADRVFELVAAAPAVRWQSQQRTLEAALATFAPLAEADGSPAADRLELVSLPAAMAIADFAARYPSSVPLEELALLNRVTADGTLGAGTLAKRVVAAERPQPAAADGLGGPR